MSVFSTSFGPRPGASVPMTSTGGVSSGKVSTLMRGVTTPAKTMSAMQTIRIAIGLRSERPVTSVDSLRVDAVAVVEERAPFGDDLRAGAQLLRLDEQAAARSRRGPAA